MLIKVIKNLKKLNFRVGKSPNEEKIGWVDSQISDIFFGGVGVPLPKLISPHCSLPVT